MAGYSGTPLPKKLGIREGSRVVLACAPEGFAATLELPIGALFVDDGRADVAVLFVTEERELWARFGPLMERLEPNGGLWVAWPKKAARVPTDLTFEVVQPYGLSTGMVDNKVCAIDETWTGLRFVYRLKDRPALRSQLRS